MNNLKNEINHRVFFKRRASIDSKVNLVKSNPENEIFKRK
jgi:hypothetical protein